MKSAQIICPKCRKSLNLPAQMEVMRDVHKGGGSYIAFGDPNRQMLCPHCGHGLRVGDIIEGKYNPKPTGCPSDAADLFGIAVGIGLIVVAIVLFRACVLG